MPSMRVTDKLCATRQLVPLRETEGRTFPSGNPNSVSQCKEAVSTRSCPSFMTTRLETLNAHRHSIPGRSTAFPLEVLRFVMMALRH